MAISSNVTGAWDPAMSRVAAISATRIRLSGGQEKQQAGSAEGGEKQGVRHGKQALPVPQGRSSGRQAGGEGPAVGSGHSPS